MPPVLLQIVDRPDLVVDGVGVGDQLGVTRGVGLKVHVVAPDAVVGEQLGTFARQDAQRHAEFHIRYFPVYEIDGVEYLPELRIGLEVAVSAGDVAEGGDSGGADFARFFQYLFRWEQIVGLYAGPIVGALGAEAAILTAAPGFCVDY